MNKRTLYITYDGLTDPLGGSQIIPYIKIISQNRNLSILSFEKEKNVKFLQEVYYELDQYKINFFHLDFTNKYGKLGRLIDIIKLLFYSAYLIKKNKYKIIHARSHIPAFVVYLLKYIFKINFIFDFRGLWIDERIDNLSFNTNSFFSKIFYKFMKIIEKKLLSTSDMIIVLTEKIVPEIKKITGKTKIKINVIPCCADYDFFNKDLYIVQIEKLKKELNINKNHKVISYCGSLGGVYLFDDMINFFKILKENDERFIFIFITNDPKKALTKLKKYKNDNFVKFVFIKNVERKKIPIYLSLSDIMIFFINNTYARQASSPTKLAESLALGIPVISNKNVGDIDTIIKRLNAGIVLDCRNLFEINNCIKNISKIIKLGGNDLRERSRKFLGLEIAKKKYLNIYDELDIL